MKKIILTWIKCVILVSLTFANGTKEDDTGPITLVMWTHEDPNRQKLEEAWAAEYMEKNPHVTIK